MKKKLLVLLSLSLLAWLGLGWPLAENDSAEAHDNSQATHPLEAINQMAKNARSGNLSDAEEFVGEIIKVTGFENELRGFTSTAIKDRVGRAESRYRQGQSLGIPESKIVRTVNGLVRKFELPPYTKTNNYEVRMLRLGLLPSFPQIISQPNQGIRPVSVGGEMDSQMSPAEAFFMLAMMLRQKLVNPDYQLTYQERVASWAETHKHVAEQDIASDPSQVRSDQIRDSLKRAVSSASVTDALQLSEITLNTLGIEQ